MIYLTYPLIILIIVWNIKIAKGGELFEDYLTLSESKNVQGLFAILIMFHHISQKLCDTNSVREKYIVHGLEPFMYIGYLLVAYYFFSSGYGLYRSIKSKDNYLEGFLFKHLAPIFVVLAISSYLFMFVATNEGLNVRFNSPITLFGPSTNNPYSWYIYAIIYCYIIFKIAFKRFKTESRAIAFIFICIIAYMLFCNYWLYGDWWYNTILVFPMGILFAKNRDRIEELLKANYKKSIIILLLALTIGFAGTELLSNATHNTNILFGYQAGQFLLAILRNTTALCFVLLILMGSMRIKIGNRLLGLVGGCTLEFYLVHGFFVQLFSSEFLQGTHIQVYYIKNPLIYVLIVFILSVLAAFLGKIAVDWVINWMYKSLYAKAFGKDMVKIGIGVLVILVIITAKTKYEDVKKTNLMEEEFRQFSEEQEYVELDNGKMSYYIQGEGDHTIVLLGLNLDPSSQLIQRYVTRYLAKDSKVVIFDIIGRGFSDDALTPRTAENVANELHEALVKLEIDDKYIFMPCEYNATYVMKYLEKYPDEVEAIIGVDMMVPGIYDAVVKGSGVNKALYETATIKESIHALHRQKILKATGYVRWEYLVYEGLWNNTTLEQYLPMIEEMYVRRANMDTAVEEKRLWGTNCDQVSIDKFPEDLPVLMMVDYVLNRADIGSDSMRDIYDSYITNPEIQSITVMEGDPYFICYKGAQIAQKVRVFIRDCM